MTNTTNAKERNTILVIGSTGKTGKRVADQLENRGIPVRQGSRSSDIPFDWEEPQTWAPALAGVDKAYLTYYPDLAVPGSVDAMRKLTDLAKDAGVNRLVLLAGRGEEEASGPRTSSRSRDWSGPLSGPPFSRRTSARAPGSMT